MSSAKRYEKTFSRKKKENSNDRGTASNEDDEKQVILSIAANSRQPSTSKTVEKQKNSKQKQQTKSKKKTPEKQKRKVENGDADIEEVTLEKTKKKKTKPKNQEAEEDEQKKEENSECTFPTSRIARIIKSEGPEYRLSQESVFLINKATEKFIELFSQDAYDCAVEERKSFVAYKHLSTAVSQEKRFDFLSDFVPEKVTAEKALAERKPAETSQSPGQLS